MDEKSYVKGTMETLEDGSIDISIDVRATGMEIEAFLVGIINDLAMDKEIPASEVYLQLGRSLLNRVERPHSDDRKDADEDREN